jgi:hypothetical protein
MLRLTRDACLSLPLRTAAASGAAAVWRAALTPLDTVKVAMQARVLSTAHSGALRPCRAPL